MQITKSDFIQYLNCPNSLWLMLNKPLVYPHGEFSAFQSKLAAEGYEVEVYVRAFIDALPEASEFHFQHVFETDDLYAKADIIRANADGTIDLYEIKSSTSVKDKNPHNQLKDAAFQAIVAEKCGYSIGKIFIVHLNKDYRREGDVDPAQLLVFADETVRIKALLDETRGEVEAALALIALDEIDETSCSCLNLGKAKHCDSFDYFNPTVPKPSIYNLPRISTGANFHNFVAEGRFDLSQISPDEVSNLQAIVLASYQTGKPVINEAVIESFLGSLVYPLYFFDYEGYGSAIPICDGANPQGQFPFQFSLHVMQEDGELEHFEYLADNPQMPSELIEHLEGCIGSKGSIVVWHKAYEITRTKEMAAFYPHKADFLYGLIDRVADLEDVFKEGYVDIAFGGSTSIKKGLPVLSDLSYDGMEVSGGTEAMEAWKTMLELPHGAERDAKRKALLEYCKQDTLAMVRIFEFVQSVVA